MNEVLHALAMPARPARDGPDASPAVPHALRFFGSAMLARTPETLPLGVRAILAWSASEADRRVVAGRAGAGGARVLALRLAYQALKAEAAAVKSWPSDAEQSAGMPPAPVLAALPRLRHRQRAALICRFGLGMGEADVARVLGVQPGTAVDICERASAALLRAAGRPMDVPRALRKAGREPKQAAAAREQIATVTPLPRAVTRLLIAPVVPQAPRPAVDDTAVIAHRRRQLAESTAQAAPARTRGWSLLWRVAAVTSVGLLFGWAVWPHP